MNNRTTTTILAGGLLLLASTASAQVTAVTVGGHWNDAATWSDAAVPTAGNDYTSDIRIRATSTSTFSGGTLTFNAGGNLASGALNVDATFGGDTFFNDGSSIDVINNSIFDVFGGGNDVTFSGQVTLNAGALSARILRLNNMNLLGSGAIIARSLTAGIDSRVLLLGGNDFSGFTGNLVVGGTGQLGIQTDINTATFGFDIQANSLYENGNNLSVTSLTILGETIGAGVYNRADLVAINAAYGDVLSSAASADGIITVVPEPSTYALIGGLLALSAVMIRRRK